MLTIGIVGDFDAANETRLATNAAIEHAATAKDLVCATRWVATDEVARCSVASLNGVDGLVIAPGSPYRSCAGALQAIEHARMNDTPLLGTCGGFQHVLLEFARNVVGFEGAAHGEYDPYASKLFITPLSCSLLGQVMTVHIEPGSRAGAAYRSPHALEHYYCNLGLNPAYLDDMVNSGMCVAGVDQDGEPRILELSNHRFFVATLFVPQTSSTPGTPHPLILDFVTVAGAC